LEILELLKKQTDNAEGADFTAKITVGERRANGRDEKTKILIKQVFGSG
jgi:hypothetical protein